MWGLQKSPYCPKSNMFLRTQVFCGQEKLSIEAKKWQRLGHGNSASVKVGGVPQCSREVEHCGTLGTPAPFQSSVEWCGTAWNGCALTTPVTPCHHLSTLGTEKY